MQKTKKCKKHGLTEYIQTYNGYLRCKKCRSEAVTNNRRKRKQKLVEYFGGKCQVCGYNKCIAALDFHHKNPEEKNFAISKSGVCRSWERMLAEANKCILVCCRCHKEIEFGLINCE